MAPLRQRWARNWGAESRSQASRIFLVHSLPHPRYLVLPLFQFNFFKIIIIIFLL